MAPSGERPQPAVAPSALQECSLTQWEYRLQKYLLLLATLLAMVTYSAGFNPLGGVWQDTRDAAGHLAGDPIFRDTRYIQYAVFFYCNACAFALSLVVVLLLYKKAALYISLQPLRLALVLDLFSLMMAYSAGTGRNTLTIVYSSVLMGIVFINLIFQVVHTSFSSSNTTDNVSYEVREQPRVVLMLTATFALSVTYVTGLNTPGGIWDNAEGGHHLGDAILMDHHNGRLTVFFVCNTTVFAAASLLIILQLLNRKLLKTVTSTNMLYGCIMVVLVSFVGAYAAGSSREAGATTYIVSLLAVVLLCILLYLTITKRCKSSWPWADLTLNPFRQEHIVSVLSWEEQLCEARVNSAISLVLLLATLIVTVTYQASLDPPGGVWQESRDGHIAGDSILLTTNPKRYKAFFYCNSVAFVASLVVIVLVQKKLLLRQQPKKLLLRHHLLQHVMIFNLFGLIGAYAAGSCRDVSTSIYVMILAGAVLVYVVIHIIFFDLNQKDKGNMEGDCEVDKKHKLLFLFATLAATVTYQAGLTPPSGFHLHDNESSGYHAGDPLLFYNFPRRYMAFFYCNSISFMMSIALIILLLKPKLYRLAIRTSALSVCTAAGLFSLMGAYISGSSQHRSGSIGITVLLSLLLAVPFLLLFVNSVNKITRETTAYEEEAQYGKKKRSKRKHLMILGILVASATYQAGLRPPGGVRQHTADGHDAGNPVMHDNKRRRYYAFFYCNSTAFVASIVEIILLLPPWLQKKEWWFRVMNTTIVLDLLALLGAYATGSSRDWKTSAYVAAPIAAMLAYVVVHVMLSFLCSFSASHQQRLQPELPHQQGNAGELP